jgi:hypothetical protein
LQCCLYELSQYTHYELIMLLVGIERRWGVLLLIMLGVFKHILMSRNLILAGVFTCVLMNRTIWWNDMTLLEQPTSFWFVGIFMLSEASHISQGNGHTYRGNFWLPMHTWTSPSHAMKKSMEHSP